MDQQKQSITKWIILFIIVIFLGGLLAYLFSQKSQNNLNIISSPLSDQIQVPTMMGQRRPMMGVSFKDGTYTSVGNYFAPSGSETIGVTMMLKNNIVTEVRMTADSANDTAHRWQERFIAGSRPLVIGKKISELNISDVSGSSLTPQGFNDALAKIQSQAKI